MNSMEIKSMSQSKEVQAMQKALDAYLKDSSTAKPLFESMKEISSWLASKGK